VPSPFAHWCVTLDPVNAEQGAPARISQQQGGSQQRAIFGLPIENFKVEQGGVNLTGLACAVCTQTLPA